MSLFGSLPLPSKQTQTSNQQQETAVDTPIATPSKTTIDKVSNSLVVSCSEEKPKENKQLIVATPEENIAPAKPKGLSSFSLVPSSVKLKQTPRSNPFKSSSDNVKKIGTIIDDPTEDASQTLHNKRKLNNSMNNSTRDADEYDPLIPNKYEEYLSKKSKKNQEETIELDELEEDELMLSTPNQSIRSTPLSVKSSTKSTISFNLQKKTPDTEK